MLYLSFLSFNTTTHPPFCFISSALKLRYTLPIHIPSHLSTNPSSTPLSSPSAKMQSFTFPAKQRHRRESPIVFDARVVAKKDAGWEDMLESVLMRWVDKVVEERRVDS